MAHIAFLKALEEEGIRPDYITGSSMGSIVGACCAKGMSADEMKRIIEELTAFDIVDLGFSALGKLGLMRWTKVRKMMSSFLEDCDFSDLEIPFGCVAVDLKSGTLHEFYEGKVVDAILASSSMPTVFRPVELDGMLLIGRQRPLPCSCAAGESDGGRGHRCRGCSRAGNEGGKGFQHGFHDHAHL